MKGVFFVAALPAFAMALSATVPGLAQDSPHRSETVVIETANALPGIWRFPPHERRSEWTAKGSDVVADFTAMGPERFCRIGHASAGYTFNCLEVAERSPRARLIDDRQVSLSWTVLFGVPGCRWLFRGQLQSGTEMVGHLGMACGMVVRERAQPLTVGKLVLSEKTPDAGGQAAFLKQLIGEMATGKVNAPYVRPRFVSSDPAVVPLPDEVQAQLLTFLSPDILQLLGNVTAVVYVGDYHPIAGWRYDQASPAYSEKQAAIYAVEFENGERLCALHRRPDGVLDLFQCI